MGNEAASQLVLLQDVEDAGRWCGLLVDASCKTVTAFCCKVQMVTNLCCKLQMVTNLCCKLQMVINVCWVQDAKMFRRKKWKYLILDEAHMIKNWKSLRWQTLLNFNSARRLLITGTPLQVTLSQDESAIWAFEHPAVVDAQ